MEYFGLGSKEMLKNDGDVKSQLKWTPTSQILDTSTKTDNCKIDGNHQLK